MLQSARAHYRDRLLGRGVPKDDAEAVRWYRKSAEQGNARAQDKLAWLYANARGVPKDDAEAVRWYRKAADQGNANAQFVLGVWYGQGRGVKKDYAEAVRWLLKVANRGYPPAQGRLGAMYHDGLGVPRDYVQAYMWSNLAAAGGENLAIKDRDSTERLMTPEQIAEAQRLAAAWKPTTDDESQPAAPVADPNHPFGVDEAIGPEKPSASFGTAFFVSMDGKAVTNAHVVKACTGVAVQGVTGKRSAARVVARDKANDIALLQVQAQPQSVARFRLQNARLAESILLFGFPLPGLLASSGNATLGNVTALAGIGDDANRLQVSAPVQPGNSGGPVLDNAANVIGVVVSKLDAGKVASVVNDVPQNVNFAIKASVVTNFLDAHSVHYVTDQSATGMPITAVAKAAEGFTIQVICTSQ